MTKKEQFIKDFRERRKREREEYLRLLREKYSKLSETEISELFNKAMEFQLGLENKSDSATNTGEPKVKKKSILDDPKQRRVFEGMGSIFKVTKSDKGDTQGEII